jgi:HEAT repeat protein
MPIFKFSRRPNVQRLKTQGDVDGLIEALGYEDDHNIRLAAASALGRIGDTRAVKPLIVALDDRLRVKEVAAQALGEIGDPVAVEPLIATLGDENWEVRSTVAKALGKIGDPRAKKPLVNLLNDKSENVRWYASQALETIAGESFGEDIDQWEQKDNQRD